MGVGRVGKACRVEHAEGRTGRERVMKVELRPGRRDDAEVCGRICHDAFGAIAAAHGFPSDFPTPQVGLDVASAMLAHPQIYAVVAELDGQVVGSNFLDERSAIAGVGPVSVDPAAQNRGVGRALMLDVLRRAADRQASGVRLLQAAYHSRSLSLYATLGFTVRDVLACMQGTPLTGRIRARPGRSGSGSSTSARSPGRSAKPSAPTRSWPTSGSRARSAGSRSAAPATPTSRSRTPAAR